MMKVGVVDVLLSCLGFIYSIIEWSSIQS